MDNISMPTSGELFRVTVLADASLAVGAMLSAEVTGSEFTRTADSNGESVEDVNFTICITESRTVLDENSIIAPVYEEDANVLVRRTIAADTWSTICLPFAMSEEQVKATFGNDVELGDFTGYDTAEDAEENIVGITLNFDDVTAIEANHPYIIKVSNALTEFSVDGVTIDPEDVPCVALGTTTGKGKNAVYHPMDFTGTYLAEFDFYNDAQSRALFLSDNKFYYATENTKHMKAFRAYFDFDDVLTSVENAPSAARMRISSDKETSKIENVEFLKHANRHVYSVGGQDLGEYSELRKLPKGVYIMDGKKRIVK